MLYLLYLFVKKPLGRYMKGDYLEQIPLFILNKIILGRVKK